MQSGLADAVRDGLPQPRRFWSALAIWIAIAVSILDGSVANIALPTIAAELHESAASVVWIVNAYQIAILMVLFTAASLGEVVGFRRVYLFGLVGFAFGSTLCTVAPNLTALSLARFVQGTGAACVMAVNGALVRATYPRRHLGRGLGFNTMVGATASAAGPTIAAAIIGVASWRWIFGINLPLCLLALMIGWRTLPETPRREEPVGWRDAVLSAATFAGLFIGAADVAQGASPLHAAAELTAGLACGVALLRRSRKQRRPFFPLDLLAVPLLRLSYAASLTAFAAFTIIGVALPFFLQRALHVSPVMTGVLLTPLPLAIAFTAPLAGYLVDRISAGLLGGIGLTIVALALLALGFSDSGSAPLQIAILIALAGVGFGLFQTPNNRTMLGAAPEGRSGAAGAMLATARLIGQTGGAVMAAALFNQVGSASALPLLLAAALGACASAMSFKRASGGLRSAK